VGCLRSVRYSISVVSSEEGHQIDESDEHSENANRPTHESVEPDSNVTVERDGHRAKDSLPRVLTEEGRQIDKSDEQ
jgi:hypothetical protein